MAAITRNRTIRPSSRKATSKNYKVDTKNIDSGDTLTVNIGHESKAVSKSYSFAGKDVAHRDSISFRVTETASGFDITWSGVEPDIVGVTRRDNFIPHASKPQVDTTKVEGQINGLPPIADEQSKVLILGTMPGMESLRQ